MKFNHKYAATEKARAYVTARQSRVYKRQSPTNNSKEIFVWTKPTTFR